MHALNGVGTRDYGGSSDPAAEMLSVEPRDTGEADTWWMWREITLVKGEMRNSPTLVR